MRKKIIQLILISLGAGLTGASLTMDNTYTTISLFLVGLGLLVTAAYLIRKTKNRAT